jgi:hypothetical protein
MGVALDTIGFLRTATASPDTSPIAATVTPGDSFTVRSFQPADQAQLRNIFQKAAHTLNTIRVRSPYFHDNVRGIAISPGESPGLTALPQQYCQQLRPQDNLIVEVQEGTASETLVGALSIYYTNLIGTAARIHPTGDIFGNILDIKPVEVDVAMGSVAGAWVDTLINNLEDLLHANKDYAVLGYGVSNPVAAVGIKGSDTANLRVCGPGNIRQTGTADYFAELAQKTAMPYIPVFNSANKGSTFVSVLSNAEAATYKIVLMLAELVTNLNN